MFRPSPITLQRGALRLEPMVEADVPDLVALAEANREALKFMSAPQRPDWYRNSLAEQREGRALPLVVLTGENTYRLGVPPAYAEPLSRLWSSMHEEIARQSSRGVNRVVRGAGHLIQVENPVAVVTAIEEVAAQAKP